MTATVELAWRRIEAWLAARVPSLLRALRPPASTADVAAASNRIGHELPADFVASLAIHDGQSVSGFQVFGDWAPYSIADAARMWAMMEELDATGTFPREVDVGAAWWRRTWLPVASDGGGGMLCLDLAPPPGVVVGQLLHYDKGSPTRDVVAPSWADWLAAIATQLERGDFVVVDDLFLDRS